MKATYRQRIVRNIRVCGGEPVFRGTRVRLKVVLDNLAEGRTAAEILVSYPSLKAADVQAAITFAAAAAADDMTFPATEALLAV
jgi:uncharacterized protein (DUF433 family)